jgi:hypothetical protein
MRRARADPACAASDSSPCSEASSRAPLGHHHPHLDIAHHAELVAELAVPATEHDGGRRIEHRLVRRQHAPHAAHVRAQLVHRIGLVRDRVDLELAHPLDDRPQRRHDGRSGVEVCVVHHGAMLSAGGGRHAASAARGHSGAGSRSRGSQTTTGISRLVRRW